VMGGKKPPSDASSLGYAQRKVAETTAKADVKVAELSALRDVICEVIRTAKSHPIMGLTLAVVTADILEQGGVIRTDTRALVNQMCGIAFGVSVSIEVVDGVANLIHSFESNPFGGNQTPDPANLIRPSASTIVENPPTPPSPSRGGPPPGALL
jgi:hypothetical protein